MSSTSNTPVFMYGTAWKEERTAQLTSKALAAGFRAIDTANQRKHYFEAGVGEAIAKSGVPREQLFLQTKFTYRRGQDERLPYDENAALAEQVEQSFASSLDHLGVAYLDSYVLHGPWAGEGISAEDREVWSMMESLQKAGKCSALGVSNTSLEQLRALCEFAGVAPSYVQNRCFARTRWDADVRAFCSDNGIVYQGFSLLTANRRELSRPELGGIAQKHNATIAQLVFRYAIAVGMLPLTGTSSDEHMALDLACTGFELSPADISLLEGIAEL